MIIPEVRAELLKIAARLRELEKELYRRKSTRRTKTRSQAFTPDLKRQLRAYSQANPTLSRQQIADRFKVNQGRVTDAILGKRK
jgi:hypothetical protein